MTKWSNNLYMSDNGYLIANIYKPFMKWNVIWVDRNGKYCTKKFWSYGMAWAFLTELLK